jgi:hypothetical protein
MLKYITNIFIILFFIQILPAQTQRDSISIKNDTLILQKDSLIDKKQVVKIRFGFDLGSYIREKINDSYSYIFFTDVNFYKNYYIYLETGFSEHLTDHSLLTYRTKGNYLKSGIDYNIYENWLDMDNDITIGIRFGHATYQYQPKQFRINQPGAIYTPEIQNIDKTFDNLSANWVEISAKIQAELFYHIYLGYAISIKNLLSYTKIDEFETSFIPGFNQKNSYSNFGFGMQYFISYRLKF